MSQLRQKVLQEDFSRHSLWTALTPRDDGGGEAEEIKVFSEWFFTQRFAVNLEYNERENDDTDIESEAILIGARLRF